VPPKPLRPQVAETIRLLWITGESMVAIGLISSGVQPLGDPADIHRNQ
jgi:hypothetical protein